MISPISQNQIAATKGRQTRLTEKLSKLSSSRNDTLEGQEDVNSDKMEIESLKQFQEAQDWFNDKIYSSVKNLMGISKFHNEELEKSQEMILALDDNQE